MNIQLANAEEFVDLKSKGVLGQILIRSITPISFLFSLLVLKIC